MSRLRTARRPSTAAVCILAGLLAGLPALSGGVRAEVALVAVAANFAEVMERLERDFERQSPHALTVTSGSTGKLYAQISAGAPFDVLLAADQTAPARLESAGLAVRGSRFTYAAGRLLLWSADANLVAGDGAEVLRRGEFRRLAMANPELAPYGVAARELLEALNLFDDLRERIVMGENIGQTHAMVATGNAELGLVARSFVLSERNAGAGSYWAVPARYHAPIRQDAVLLTRAEDNSAARDLLAYLRRPDVRAVIREYGYDVD